MNPIIAYRAWGWDGSQLLSLNGEPWPPGKAMSAKCTAKRTAAAMLTALPKLREGTLFANAIEHMIKEAQAAPEHQAPFEGCGCGIYALKSPVQLSGGTIYGEVYLWGKVIEHRHGYRAEFGYPKSFESESGLGARDAELLKQLTARYGIETRISLLERWHSCLVTVRRYGRLLPIGFDVRESDEGQILSCRIVNDPDVKLEP